MKRQRARRDDAERDVDRLRQGRPLSPEAAARVKELAARQMEIDAYDVLRKATFVPDPPEEKPDPPPEEKPDEG